MRVSSVVSAGLAAVFVAAAASAAPLSCSTDKLQFDLSNAIDSFCYQKHQLPGAKGNDKRDITSAFTLFGLTGWKASDANDDASGDGTIEFKREPKNGTKSGDWTIDTLAGLTKVVIVLKSSTSWGAFLLDLSVKNPLAGRWKSSRNLSHATIYYNDSPDVTNVPVPASGLLFAGGLGILGLVARRRRHI